MTAWGKLFLNICFLVISGALLSGCGLIQMLGGASSKSKLSPDTNGSASTEGNGDFYSGGDPVYTLLATAKDEFVVAAKQMIEWDDYSFVCQPKKCESNDASLCAVALKEMPNILESCHGFMKQILPNMIQQLDGPDAIKLLVSKKPVSVKRDGTVHYVSAKTLDDPKSPIIFDNKVRDSTLAEVIALLFHELGHRFNFGDSKILDSSFYFGIKGDQYLDKNGARFAVRAVEKRPKVGGLIRSFFLNELEVGEAEDDGSAFTLDSQGRILFGGGIDNSFYYAARLDRDGNIDESYGTDGYVKTSLGGGGAFNLTYKDGKTILVGVGHNGSNYDMAFMRLTSDGVLDRSFGSGGKVWVDNTRTEAGRAVAVGPDGRIVGVGYAYVGTTLYPYIARLNINGSPDNTFSGNGRKLLSFGASRSSAKDVIVLPDNKIVVMGSAQFGESYTLFLARMNEDGTMDTSFGQTGYSYFSASTGSAASRMIVDARGRILVAGVQLYEGGSYPSVFRFQPNGNPDLNFGVGGQARVAQFSSGNARWADLMVQPNGKILAVGDTPKGSERIFIAARFLPNGQLDPTFGNQGVISNEDLGDDFVNYSFSSRAPIKARIRNDGTVVLLGNVLNGNQRMNVIWELNLLGL